MKCRRCGVVEVTRERAFDSCTCESCRAGMARFAALARHRPLLAELRGHARECLVWWETARLGVSRGLRPLGVHVKWRGLLPVVSVIPRPVLEEAPEPLRLPWR